MTEIKCCAECKFVGEERYKGSHIWCGHPEANWLSLPNRDLEIHPDCPISTITLVSHVIGEYDKNVSEYIGNVSAVRSEKLYGEFGSVL